MRSTKSFLHLLLFLTAFAGTAFSAAAEQLYTCGMHPQIIKKEPGNCPICGMKLVPIRSNGGAPAAAGERKIKYWKSSMNPGEVSPKPGKDSMGMDLVPVYDDDAAAATAIHIDPVTIQRMNLKTGLVTRGPVLREIRTVGTVAFDEAGLRDITTKYGGWIEKLFVDTTWATVRAGEPLFEIYSPDLYNAELNYQVALRSEGAAGGPLTRAARARLQLFDVPDDFVASLARDRETPRTFTYRAPADGVVIDKMAVVGRMVAAGERLFRLADLSHVWVEAQVYEQDLPFVQAGQDATVRVTYGPERTIEGKVDLLLPQVVDQTRTATARIVLPNADGALRPGMFVDVRFAAQLADDAVLVPDLAVLRSGEHNTVFLANADGSFSPREVRLGVRSQGDVYQVLEGLAGGERVVTSGQFMLDSESQLRDAIQKMLSATDGAAPTPAAAPAEAKPRPDGHAAIGMDDVSMLPAEARARLRDLAVATIAGGDALAADDFAGYQKQLPAIRQALAAFFSGYDRADDGPLGKFKDNLPDRADLKAAQRDFAYFSTAVADLARANRLPEQEHWHVFECPMAPGIGTGRWLQASPKLKNPFYGSAMLECGEEIK
ncbi:MAG TPA: efflux RND transporter periplasmic adaptor subunit [Lacunisphaera sp.]|nr:efflux RND transporter periplasmic adaptor subunit [Lacunisphaera sp.]